ncbi:MAG: type VI secretion system tip protein VgrG [Desulfovibrio sp.]|nr:type VI secretion system tip protein VgrG [Desulfovibrio sp.]
MPKSAPSIRERFRFQSAALGLDDEPLHVLRFSGTEGFSHIFAFDISLATRKKDLDADAILANPAVLYILRPGGGLARFTGYPTRLSLSSSYSGWQFWNLRLQPAFWKLTQQVENRIYLDCTVQELAKEVLDKASSLQMDYEFRLYGSYEKQDFAMQHNESLYNFLAWKLERDGIYYFFDETDSGGRVVFADDKQAHPDLPDGAKLRYSPTSGLETPHLEEVVSSFGMTATPLPRRVIERDYDWENPMLPVAAAAEVSESGLGNVYYYGDGFTTKAEGQRLAEIRAQALRCHAKVFRGESAVPTLRPGFVFSLENYFDERCNRGYLITEVRHEGCQEAWLSQAVGVVLQKPEDQVYYRNAFACIPDDMPFRPERKAERAKVAGMISAFIDASSDSAVPEINEKGCYKVVFPEDLSDRTGGKSSCWIRRMQPHVGLGHGMAFPLSPGTEVLVSFIDGNPDRPVIAGAVANAVSGAVENQASAQSSSIRTAGGSGLLFNDKETKQGLHLGTGGRSGLFMSSGSLDATVVYTDFAGKLSSGADTSFAGLAQHAVSGFSSKLEATHKAFTVWTGICEAMKDLSKVTSVFDEAFWHATLKDKDTEKDRTLSQSWASAFSGLTELLKAVPAVSEAVVGAGALGAKDPFYGAAITARESKASVALTTPIGKLQMGAYIAFATLSYLAGLGAEGLKAYSSYLSAKKDIQENQKKVLTIYLTDQYKEDMKKEHPDWPDDKITEEAKAKAALDVATKGGVLLNQNQEKVDKIMEDAGLNNDVLEHAKWHRMGRAIAQSLGSTLIPEAVAFIAVCTKAGKFTSASRIGGLLLCAQDSNTVVASGEETRLSSDKNLVLAAGKGHSIYSRYTPGGTISQDIKSAFGLDDQDNSFVSRADVLASLALKKSTLTSLGTAETQAKDSITLTTKYSNADIKKAVESYAGEVVAAQASLGLHAPEFGTSLADISGSLQTEAAQLTQLYANFTAPPTEHTTLKLGKGGGNRQEAKLDCQGPGCKISLAGTATDSAGVFEAKMTNANSTSALELKDDAASLKVAKANDESSLSIAGKSVKLVSKTSSLAIDGSEKKAVLGVNEGASKLEIDTSNGFNFTTDKNFYASSKKGMKFDADKISMLKGAFILNSTQLKAKVSGQVNIEGGMIKIG